MCAFDFTRSRTLSRHAANNETAKEIRLCIFDLDNTLLYTNDLEDFRGASNTGHRSEILTEKLTTKLILDGSIRSIYTERQLDYLKERFEKIKFSVFTRSPRYYAKTILEFYYPNFEWDSIIAREDVFRTKPDPEGIFLAAKHAGVTNMGAVVMIGDGKPDVVSAYRAGCLSIIDQQNWPNKKEPDHWRALERIPDALINSFEDLVEILERPEIGLPELEYAICATGQKRSVRRFDEIYHFCQKSREHATITVAGRFFGDYSSIRPRRAGHKLTNQIRENKESDVFPESWVDTTIAYILGNTISSMQTCTIVTVVPFKPGRKPRLENFLEQVSVKFDKLHPEKILFNFFPDVLAFKSGTKSNHSEHLGLTDRFSNIENNLYVKSPAIVQGNRIIVIDDVVTSGATLLSARHYLLEAGAVSVNCFSMTKAIGEN